VSTHIFSEHVGWVGSINPARAGQRQERWVGEANPAYGPLTPLSPRLPLKRTLTPFFRKVEGRGARWLDLLQRSARRARAKASGW